jgi:hypothetical protein
MDESLNEFAGLLQSRGLHAALDMLNSRTPHRYTGVYRYDGDMLRNVLLFDRWDEAVRGGPDAPMAQTFCAIVPGAGATLEVVDGRADERFPWMHENPVVSYCGALIRDRLGQVFGTVCHFDLRPCEAGSSQLPLLLACTDLIYGNLFPGGPSASG